MDRAKIDKVNWVNSDSHIFLNPKLSNFETNQLNELSKKFHLSSHIWIASSGSAQADAESVKLIALSKQAFLKSAEAVNKHFSVSENDKWLLVLPKFHVGGLSILARAYLSGSEVVEIDCEKKWSAHDFCQVILDQNIQYTSLVPTQVFDLVKMKIVAPRCLKAVVIGGAALSTDLFTSAVSLGWPLAPSFGMTETCSQIATARPGEFQMEILNHLQLKSNEQMLLSVRGNSLLTGYAQVVNGKEVFVDPKSADGWLQTKDHVEIIENKIIPLGRDSDFIKILGEGVSLLKLNQVLTKIAIANEISIEQLALHAKKDSKKGFELILIFEETLNHQAIQKIMDKFNHIVLPYERLNSIFQVDRIPRSSLGKILTTELELHLSNHLR